MVWMIYDGNMITGDECGQNFLTFVLWLGENPGRNFNQESDPTGDRTRARCVEVTMLPLDHSGGPIIIGKYFVCVEGSKIRRRGVVGRVPAFQSGGTV